MKVLVACEMSGRVRDAFTALGHDATSCDLMPSATPGSHYQGDVRELLDGGWELLIGHPPCTDLAVSGARHFAKKALANPRFQDEAAEFFMALYNAPIPKVAVENPVCVMSTRFRKPDQIIQPWQFGHGETKTTCLWLRGLPRLVPTDIVPERSDRIHRLPPTADRAMLRSLTYPGIAAAMAQQWGQEIAS